jgi:hypothetical protein
MLIVRWRFLCLIVDFLWEALTHYYQTLLSISKSYLVFVNWEEPWVKCDNCLDIWLVRCLAYDSSTTVGMTHDDQITREVLEKSFFFVNFLNAQI